jgi:hypothetical protein
MVAVPSYLDVDKVEADSFLAYVARLRSASSTTTTTAATSASSSSPSSSPQPSPSTKKKQEKQKKEKRSGSGMGGSTAAAGGEKATNKRWKRRKQSLGEVAVSEEAPATTTSSSPRREGIAETVLADRVQIQVRALARYNLLARATTHVAEREA